MRLALSFQKGVNIVAYDVTLEGVAIQYDAAPIPLGSIVEVDGRRFKCIEAGAAIAAGDAMIQDFTEGVNVYAPSAAVDTVVHGICETALADGKFGYMLIEGLSLVAKCAATIVVGQPLMPTATAGTLDDITIDAANAGMLAAGPGIVAVTTTTAGVATVLLN